MEIQEPTGLQTCWKPIGRHAPTWGNWMVLLLPARCSPDSRIGSPSGVNETESISSHLTPYDATHLPPIRAGGGLQRAVAHRRDVLKLHEEGSGAVALNPRGKWYGAEAGDLNLRFIESAIGGSIADSARKNYNESFEQWPTFRRVNGKSPFMDADPLGVACEEESALAYLALPVGPLGKDIATVVGRLNSISYFHRVRTGINPISLMPRVSLMIRGLRMAKGPTQRKLLVSIEDLNILHSMLDHDNIDQQIVWAAVLLSWFFMLRMGEMFDNNDKCRPSGRHPLIISDIDLLCKGNLTHRGEHVDEIMAHISGSKTDWLNQGCVRSHAQVDPSSPNAHICAVKALRGLFAIYPAKFTKHLDQGFSTWRTGDNIPPTTVNALLRSAVAKNGHNPLAFALHSLRVGGATALYRATRDIDLVARFGRWKAAFISAYLWEIHRTMAGLSDYMTTGGHTIHTTVKPNAAARDPPEPPEPCDNHP